MRPRNSIRGSVHLSVHPSVNPYVHPSILLIGVFVEKGQGMGALAVVLVLWPKVAFAQGGHDPGPKPRPGGLT